MVPRHRRSTFGRRAFSVAGPMEWILLPHSSTLLGVLTASDRRWKLIFIRSKGTISALEALRDALYKSTTTTTESAVKPQSVNSAAHNAATFQRRCNYRYKGVRDHICLTPPESINSEREIYSTDVFFSHRSSFIQKILCYIHGCEQVFLVRGCSQVFGVLRSHLAVSAIPPIGD